MCKKRIQAGNIRSSNRKKTWRTMWASMSLCSRLFSLPASTISSVFLAFFMLVFSLYLLFGALPSFWRFLPVFSALSSCIFDTFRLYELSSLIFDFFTDFLFYKIRNTNFVSLRTFFSHFQFLYEFSSLIFDL